MLEISTVEYDRGYGVYKKDIGELKNHNTEIPCTV